MDSSPDIQVNLPAELVESLSKVIQAGLQRADIPREERINLSSWWEAEEEFLLEERANRSK